MSSCISSKEELVAKQLVNGAMVTMNHDTTQFVWKKIIKFKMTQVFTCSFFTSISGRIVILQPREMITATYLSVTAILFL